MRIHFLVCISMLTGDTEQKMSPEVHISRLEFQGRKCLRKYNLNEISFPTALSITWKGYYLYDITSSTKYKKHNILIICLSCKLGDEQNQHLKLYYEQDFRWPNISTNWPNCLNWIIHTLITNTGAIFIQIYSWSDPGVYVLL